MTYFERKNLLKNTLNSFKYHNYKNFEVIVVDDGSEREKLPDDFFRSYNFIINYIYLNPKEKWYKNSCIPYNIGIREAKGEIIILQNAECIHKNNILDICDLELTKDNYLTFACYSLNKDETGQIEDNNKIIYSFEEKKKKALSNGESGWYNHSIYRPSMYHFTAAIYKCNLNKLGGFDERYAKGIGYDDDELLDRIKKCKLNIKIVDYGIVLHQWHYSYNKINYKYILRNKILYNYITKKENSIRANLFSIKYLIFLSTWKIIYYLLKLRKDYFKVR